jgi:dynein heavy chain
MIENLLVDYNINAKTPMDLVFFNFFIDHVSRISRILKQSNGHSLLIGLGGTGRSSVVKLATFMANYELFQIDVNSKYKISDWKNDLKHIIRQAGEKKIVFFIRDNQIIDDSFLEDISIVLNASNIQLIFENDEKVEILEKVSNFIKRILIKIE